MIDDQKYFQFPEIDYFKKSHRLRANVNAK